MLALSTAWNANKRQTGLEIIREIEQLGLRSIELNFSLTNTMVDEILGYCRDRDIAIVSLHNYCPTPPGLERPQALPDCYSLASLDEDIRKKAVAYTQETISTARRAKASTVVLHCGRVGAIEEKTRDLIRLVREGKKQTPQYQETFEDFIKERKLHNQEYIRQILKSLEELGSYAGKNNITLGLENRIYYSEIPFFEEFGIIFDKLKNHPLAFWLDVGHNHVLEQLGFMPRGELLRRYGQRLVGVHLHNVKGLEDHQAANTGEVDFSIFKPYISDKTLLVMELHENSDAEQVRQSVRIWKGVFGE